MGRSSTGSKKREGKGDEGERKRRLNIDVETNEFVAAKKKSSKQKRHKDRDDDDDEQRRHRKGSGPKHDKREKKHKKEHHQTTNENTTLGLLGHPLDTRPINRWTTTRITLRFISTFGSIYIAKKK
jgi:hypothetical protein